MENTSNLTLRQEDPAITSLSPGQYQRLSTPKQFRTTISEAKQRIDIVSTIQAAGIELHQRGAHYWGLCPFHGEKSPSFTVNTDRQRFHCFGCGESGDAIDFIRKIHGFSFPDALKHLGIARGPMTPEAIDEARRQKRRRDLMESFRRWKSVKADEIGTVLRVSRKLTGQIRTVEDLDRLGDAYHLIPLLEHQLEILISGSDKAQFQYWRSDNGKI